MKLLRRHRHDDPLACREFVELVTDYLEGAMPANDVRRFEAHLGECGGCEAYLDQIRITVRSLSQVPPEPPDPKTRAHLLAAFRELRGA